MFESMGYAAIQIAEGQRQIGLAMQSAFARAIKRAADILARQARLGGFMN